MVDCLFEDLRGGVALALDASVCFAFGFRDIVIVSQGPRFRGDDEVILLR